MYCMSYQVHVVCRRGVTVPGHVSCSRMLKLGNGSSKIKIKSSVLLPFLRRTRIEHSIPGTIVLVHVLRVWHTWYSTVPVAYIYAYNCTSTSVQLYSRPFCTGSWQYHSTGTRKLYCMSLNDYTVLVLPGTGTTGPQACRTKCSSTSTSTCQYRYFFRYNVLVIM